MNDPTLPESERFRAWLRKEIDAGRLDPHKVDEEAGWPRGTFQVWLEDADGERWSIAATSLFKVYGQAETERGPDANPNVRGSVINVPSEPSVGPPESLLRGPTDYKTAYPDSIEISSAVIAEAGAMTREETAAVLRILSGKIKQLVESRRMHPLEAIDILQEGRIWIENFVAEDAARRARHDEASRAADDDDDR